MSTPTPLTTKTYTYKTQPPPSSLSILATAHYLPAYTGAYTGANSPLRPITLCFHGGGFIIGHKDAIPKAEVDFLARDHGFVVVSVDYSLCPQVSLREGPMRDTEDAYRWCREVLPGLLAGEEDGVEVDGKRVGVLGYSAGGLLATSTAFLPNPPSAIVDFYGSKYLRDPWWTLPNANKPVPDFPPEFTNQVFSTSTIPTSFPILPPTSPDFIMTPRLACLLGGIKDGSSIKKLMKDESDYETVDSAARWNAPGGVQNFKGKTGVCFVHGDSDELVPVELAERAVRELRGLGVEAELVLAKGGLHGFDSDILEGREGSHWGEVERALGWLVERV
ncbi:alpha/beta-hydrolase [Terfezia boudieri ATCC MYA-4762]|uniref:Alpha/beta-hydrolase n=1 Tax=Terfezia boudieri ATCC MYA-4762 TaxID=1051890 RepID=A0A3N4LQP8_9PEZI|nr:alpha/beta-hydrolase [Terfezia boudieri ATCC MYA-4762]